MAGSTAAPLVLVAEDDEELRYLMTRALRHDGYEVVATPDADGLLCMVDSLVAAGREVGLIVSDVRMPGIDGIELTRRVCAAGLEAPVILVSAFASPQLRERAWAAGVTYLLSKPFELDDLRTLALNLLTGPASLRRNSAPGVVLAGRNAPPRAR